MINSILRILYLTSSFILLISALIWIYFITQGWALFGHLPKYGDLEIISVGGFDRMLIIFSTVSMFYGFCIWLGAILIDKIFKMSLTKKREIIAGSLIILLDILIISSPSFSWALD